MNYSVELWDNYNKAQKTLNFHLQGLKDIISLYKEQYNCQQNYALFLKKVHNSKNQITVFESLYKGFSSFKNDMMNQYNYLSEFLANLRDDLIRSLSNLYETSLKKLNFNIYEMNSMEQTYQTSVQNLENFKNNFHNFAKEAEECKMKAEYYKERNDKSLIYLIKKEETKVLNLLKKAKENEKLYMEQIDKTNNLQDDYIEIKKRNLNEIQDIEQEIGENIKDSFRKFIVFQVAYLRNMQYDIKKKSLIFENINIKKDINKFINNNKTSITHFYKYEYVPYISVFENIITKDNTKNLYSDKTINNVKIFMSNIFTKERPNEVNPNSDFNKNRVISDEIALIVNNIFKNGNLSNEDKDKINKLILLKKPRRRLLKEINNYCLNNINSSLLNESSFSNLSYLLKESLKILQVEKDYESINLILNFATTFYQISGEKEKNKFFIQNNLINEKIFKYYDLWKEITKYNIIEEMYNQKSYNLFSNKKEDEGKNSIKIKEIVTTKISLILNYMIDFQSKLSFIKQLIQEFKDYYELSEEDIEKFNSKIKLYIEGKEGENKKEKESQTKNEEEKENKEKENGEKEENKDREIEQKERDKKVNNEKESKLNHNNKNEENFIEDNDDLGNLNINEFNENNN